MAFENTMVIRTVLSFFEVEEAREASMGLSGFPLDYVFQVNPDLDYLQELTDRLNDFHSNLWQDVRGETLSEAANTPAAKEFIIFSNKLSVLYKKYECVRSGAISLPAAAYLKERFMGEIDYEYSEAVESIENFTQPLYEYEKTESTDAMMKVANALSNYKSHLFPAIDMLAYGAFLPADASSEEVNAWVESFNAFTTLYDVNDSLTNKFARDYGV